MSSKITTHIKAPDGRLKLVSRAVAEWRALAAPLEHLGFRLHAFGPGVQFQCPESSAIVDFPVSALRILNAALVTKSSEAM